MRLQLERRSTSWIVVSIVEVVNMDFEVASNDEFMRNGGCVGKNENWLRKVEQG